MWSTWGVWKGDRMLKAGDTIKCADKEDLLNTHNDLALNGVYTDFLYEKDGKKGLWLEVIRVNAE